MAAVAVVSRILTPLCEDGVDEDMLSYIIGAAGEASDADELMDTIGALLPSLDELSEADRRSVAARVLAGVTGKGEQTQAAVKPTRNKLSGGSLRAPLSRTGRTLSHSAVAAATAGQRSRGRGRGRGTAPPAMPAALGSGAAIIAPKAVPGSLAAAPAPAAPPASTTTAPAPAQRKAVPPSPKLQQLQSMFPSLPPAVLARVLMKHLHSVEGAVDTLLGQEDLDAYVTKVQGEEAAAAAKVAAAAQARATAEAAAKARVLARFDEVDPNATTATPDVIRTADAGYTKIRRARGARMGKKAMKKARQAAIAAGK